MVLVRVGSLESSVLIGGGSNAWPHDITNTPSLGWRVGKNIQRGSTGGTARSRTEKIGASGGEGTVWIRVLLNIIIFQSSHCYFVFLIIILQGNIKNISIESWLGDKSVSKSPQLGSNENKNKILFAPLYTREWSVLFEVRTDCFIEGNVFLIHFN